MIIDLHCHYTLTARRAAPAERFSFEPAREDGAAAWDSCVAPRCVNRFAWRALRRLLGVPTDLPVGDKLDAALHAAYERHLLADGPVERSVLLAFDWYHAADGTRPPLPAGRWSYGSDIYTSNSLIRDLCRRYPRRFLFGASVHPYRARAADCVAEVFAAGACLLKWLPLHQNIDIRDPRTIAVLRRCAELGLPVLAHYGEEFTLQVQHREHEHVIDVLEVLRELRRAGCMPPMIVAHAATPVTQFGDDDSWRLLCDALCGEFADAPLYADISALAAYGKLPYLWRVAERQGAHGRLLFGSDFPVPLGDPLLRLAIGRTYRTMLQQPSWPQRYCEICRYVGYNDIVFHRAADVLPNLAFFAPLT